MLLSSECSIARASTTLELSLTGVRFSSLLSSVHFCFSVVALLLSLRSPHLPLLLPALADAFDEGADGETVLVKDGAKSNYVHIRIQQRNGRKSLTTVQGLAIDLDLKKILKALKKTYSTNGTILIDEDGGEIIQLQGELQAIGL
jgi:translation initiation factor 1